ncbi:hypothetical protein AB0D99_09535 [Streptomyces sp. NPDC047971]|uniref:hypothetical protein n=1 Tax=Streptomyces sp. NPDC047971 TaxID=3154499 RepID=UPI0033E789AB
MNVPRPRTWALSAAALYLGTVAVAGVLHDGATAPAFPGSVVLVVLLYATASALHTGEPPPADPAPELGRLVPLVGGALLNVLLVWAAVSFARVFVRDCRAARGARRTRGDERRADGAAARRGGPGHRVPAGPHRVDPGS